MMPSLSILIVEDEPSIADTLMYALSVENISATHVLLGGEALKLALHNTFDLVILDVGLPDISGFEVCKQLRHTCNTPVLFLTARHDEIDRILGLELGADDYVTKPFSPREVVARVRGILRRTQPQPAVSAQKDDPVTASMQVESQLHLFSLNSESARITYRGALLNLTRYEYLLLKTLIAQPQRIFSRAQLMDLIWQDAAETLERTVDAHIKTLRAKLHEVDKETTPIITHRGMGYSLQG